MGLDMYLIGKRFLWFDEFELQNKLNKVLGSPLPPTTEDQWGQPHVQLVELQLGYWRKANAIHQWFVENVQSGEDDCREYNVSIEQLQKLKEVCQLVLADHSKARDLLPTQEGFFFGGTDYDEWYFQDLEYTVKIIDFIEQSIVPLKKYDLYYQSSW